jgi:S1-C subfamily serine protease
MARAAENVGFALPINIAKKDINDIRKFGKIRYAYLGVRYLIINSKVKEEKGLSVDYGALLVKGPKGEEAIMPDSPAAKTGLREGDIILRLDDVRIDQDHTIADVIKKHSVGDKITLKILRDGKEMIISVILKERPEKL